MTYEEEVERENSQLREKLAVAVGTIEQLKSENKKLQEAKNPIPKNQTDRDLAALVDKKERKRKNKDNSYFIATVVIHSIVFTLGFLLGVS